MSNVLAMPNDSAVRTLVTPMRNGWWTDKALVKVARRSAFRDTNDDEFDQVVSFCKEKNLSPMSGQLYAFVFNKDDPKKRNMVIVTSIMGYRAIANRSGNYMPGQTKAFFEPHAKNPLINPRGLVRAEGGADRFIHGGWKNVTEEALWESFAPIIKSGDEDAYEWIDTGEVWPDSNKPKKKKRLKPGAVVQDILDPKKDGWHRMPDVMLKKCAEAAALRRGWPEDLSGLYVEEELHRSQVIDADYTDLTPSEIVAKAEGDDRLARIGGPALFAVTDDTGTLERIAIGRYADRMLEISAMMPADKVALLIERNRESLREFWAHNKNDALELKKELERRSGGGTVRAAQSAAPAKAAAPQQGERDMGAAAQRQPEALSRLTGALADLHRKYLLKQIAQLDTMQDLLHFGVDATAEIERLPVEMQDEVRTEFQLRQNRVKGMQ